MAPPEVDHRLGELGLAPGDRVRFRRSADRRWKEAFVAGSERDGSVRLRDAQGAARSIQLEHIEVPVTSTRGRTTWVPLPQHAVGPRPQSLF